MDAPGGAAGDEANAMKVLVVQGGPSTEAEVSRVSAAAVCAALKTAGHEAECAELDPRLPDALARFAPDVVFPAVHGELGEDGCLQGLLEVLGVPYVGSGVRASAIASDKVASKLCFARAGLPLARQSLVKRSDVAGGIDQALFSRLQDELGSAFIIKPSGGGSTIGVTRLLDGASFEEFALGLQHCLGLDEVALCESYHAGIEVNCGVLEGASGPVALPPTLIEPLSSDWYDFGAKYGVGGSRHVCPAPLEPHLTARIQAAAVLAHQALGARDLSRSDFIIAVDGSFIVLELNNLPGMTGVSLFPEAAAVAGIAFPALVDLLVQQAQRRGGGRASRGQKLPG